MRSSRRKLTLGTISVTVLALAALVAAYAGADPPGRPNRPPYPPENDPSHFTGPLVEPLPEGLPEANEGSFEGGATGTPEDAEEHNVLQPGDQREDGFWNVPTNGPPSPTFGAAPYSQQMLRFEEFGPQNYRGSWRRYANDGDSDGRGHRGGHGRLTFPAPADAYSAPDSTALEAFLAQDRLSPSPTIFANDVDENPWRSAIESYLGRSLDSPPAEGRPPGLGWSHQRAQEFRPEVWFQTAMAGSRVNGGFRDELQFHGYASGEFGPGGLYFNTAGAPGFEGTTDGIAIRFHPDMPVQQHDALWTFDGTLPPKLLQIRYGEAVLMRHYNALPIDVATNRGFGTHTITTHEHNGHSPAESDGYANAFFFPGQFYD
ncbi:MAG: copper oxidase, partial [Acidobacteria bacterium]|nr:copper oxidase [Acidobacteriota bacterium]